MRWYLLVIYFFLAAVIPSFANIEDKLKIDAYYIGGEDISQTFEFAIAKWTIKNKSVYSIELEFYTKNKTPSEKIILENGEVGGNQIVFGKTSFINRVISEKNIIAYYREFTDEDGAGYVISFYKSDDISPNGKIADIVFTKIK
jgi:hypothetical protein